MPVATLRGGHIRRVGVRQFAEVVEAGAHVQRLAVLATVIALHQGQVERGAAAVPRMLRDVLPHQHVLAEQRIELGLVLLVVGIVHPAHEVLHGAHRTVARSEEHTSELQSLMRISYAVFCLKKKKKIILMIVYILRRSFHSHFTSTQRNTLLVLY